MALNSETKQAAHNRLSFIGVIVTLGIVFGDIGTSPLYVMKAIVKAGSTINAEYITGAVSCIIWTLTLQTTIKYVLIALRADNVAPPTATLCQQKQHRNPTILNLQAHLFII